MPANVRGVGKPMNVAVVTFERSASKPEYSLSNGEETQGKERPRRRSKAPAEAERRATSFTTVPFGRAGNLRWLEAHLAFGG